MNILVTNFDNSGNNVLIFGAKNVGPEVVSTILRSKKLHFDDICTIKGEEVQYYCYDPLFVDELWEQNVLDNYEYVIHGEKSKTA